MREARKRMNDADLARELLPDLADESGFGGLAQLDLAAGEFPFPCLMLGLGSLREQDTTSALDHGGNHGQGKGILGHGHRCSVL